MNVIETKKLTKYYLGHAVVGVKDLDLEVKEGEVFGYIGPNGAGKTTTLRLLLDLIRPTSGEVKVFGQQVCCNNEQIHQDLGYLPGEIFLPENLSGKECIEYFGKFKKKVNDKYLKELISRLGLDIKKKIDQYSKGNKQKLAIVLALMHQPKLLLLDEPTSGLDPLNQREFYNILREKKEVGTTIFLSTHILSEAEMICDRVGIIKSGKLLQIENIDEFRKKNIREIHLITKTSITQEDLKLDMIKEFTKNDLGYHLITSGYIGPLIKALAKFEIDDMTITEPSLEEIFMKFYKT
jgi:ABC-2 type transport system ATP-binding protein